MAAVVCCAEVTISAGIKVNLQPVAVMLLVDSLCFLANIKSYSTFTTSCSKFQIDTSLKGNWRCGIAQWKQTFCVRYLLYTLKSLYLRIPYQNKTHRLSSASAILCECLVWGDTGWGCLRTWCWYWIFVYVPIWQEIRGAWKNYVMRSSVILFLNCIIRVIK